MSKLHRVQLTHLHVAVLIGLGLIFVMSCIETAECDENTPCDSGELCFRSFCHKTCNGPTEAHLEACNITDPNSDIICRSCDGECAGEEGYVCVRSTVCEPVCNCSEGENCCVNGSCIQ